MIKIIFILTFFLSIFCFSREYVDWCVVPNTAVTLSFLSVITIFFLCKKERLIITPWFIIALVLTGVLYLIGNKYIHSQYILLSSILTFFLFLKANSDTIFFPEIQLARIFPFILVIEAIFGILQFIQTGQPVQVKGHFDNTIGFAMSLSFSIPFLLYSVKNDTVIFKKCAYLILGIIFVALLLAGSRTVLITSCIIIILYHYQHSSWCQRATITRIIFYLLFIGIAFAAYQLKQDSANGRLLIWRTALNMIWNRPWGYGIGGVAREYMNHQAVFLSQVRDPYWLNLADNIHCVFNEYLATGIELGIGFMLLALGAFGYIIKRILIEKNEEKKLNLLLLSTILFISLFSYPLYYPVSWVVIGYSISQLLPDKKWTYTSKPVFIMRYSIVLILLLAILYQRKELQYQKRWHHVAQEALDGNKQVISDVYPQLYSRLRNYPVFLYNYGAELYDINNSDSSNKILHEYLKKVADYDAWIFIGCNYYKKRDFDKSLLAFQKAAAMCPGRLYPLYKQMLIFQKIEETEKATQIARTIVDKNVKVKNQKANKIKQAAETYLGINPFSK